MQNQRKMDAGALPGRFISINLRSGMENDTKENESVVRQLNVEEQGVMLDVRKIREKRMLIPLMI